MNDLTPTVGQWYLRRDDGRKFEVIDVDDGDGMIELQDEDGMLDQVDTEAWSVIDLELTQQPEDPTSPFDNMPLPDEADGGDPVEADSPDPDPVRLSSEIIEQSYDDLGDLATLAGAPVDGEKARPIEREPPRI